MIVAIIGYSIVEEKPSETSSTFGCICKFFTYQYGLFKRGFESCLNRFFADILCLIIHGSILCALNVGYKEIHIAFQILILEVVFYFSEFTMRIFPYSINFKGDLLKAISVYIFEIFLSQTPLFIPNKTISIAITLVTHLLMIIVLIFKRIQRRKHVTLFSKAEQCLIVNLKEDANSSINSNIESTTQHYILKYGNKIQLVTVSQPKMSPEISPQRPPANNKFDKNENLDALIAIGQIPNQVSSQPNKNLVLNELLTQVPLQNVKHPYSDDKQAMLETREKQLTISKSSMQAKFKSEDEPTARKQSTVITESPQFTSQYGPALMANSNHLILNGNTNVVNTSVCQNNLNTAINGNNNMKSISQSVLQSNHQTTVNLKCNDKNKETNSPISKNSQTHPRTRSLSLETESINIDILNTLELDIEKEATFQIISFHEASQSILIKTEAAVFFFSVPDFKKTKSILLDKNSQYLFHKSEPYCIQYHYNPSNYQFQFTQLNLSQPKITKEDMKYNSLTMQNPKYETNDLLFFSSFTSDQSSPKDILFISDGPDLITINTESLQMENYSSKLPIDDTEKVQIQQLNKRQIVINTPNQTQLTKLILDIPTNICCRKFTNLPISTEMLSIDNLQNQIILNNPKINKKACVYDMFTGETMELPDSKNIQKAWSINKMLYVIDESKCIKIYSFTGTQFNLLPPGDNGVSCVSIAFF